MIEKQKISGVPREVRACAAPDCDVIFECSVTSERKYCCPGHSRKGKCNSKDHNKRIGMGRQGIVFSEEHKEKLRNVNLGKKIFNRKRPPSFTKEHRENIRKALKGRTYLELYGENADEQKRKRVVKIMQAVRNVQNRKERFLETFLSEFFPNYWRYTGCGKFTECIAGKVPDFMCVTGQKQLIELFGGYWHGESFTGRVKEEEEQQRIDCFAKEGYQTLIIWEYELEDLLLLQEKVGEFIGD